MLVFRLVLFWRMGFQNSPGGFLGCLPVSLWDGLKYPFKLSCDWGSSASSSFPPNKSLSSTTATACLFHDWKKTPVVTHEMRYNNAWFRVLTKTGFSSAVESHRNNMLGKRRKTYQFFYCELDFPDFLGCFKLMDFESPFFHKKKWRTKIQPRKKKIHEILVV